MANEEHLAILKQGVEVWNEWRKENPKIRPVLRAVELTEANLHGADLHEADLDWTNLSGCDLSNADLSWGVLIRTRLYQTNLSEANLSNANLQGADLTLTNLIGANLQEAWLGSATFANVDLGQTRGLDTVQHLGPSSIGIDTIYRSRGEIPEVFLRGCGVPDGFIEYMRSLVGKPIEYYSCFISYASKDDEFARRLYNDLQANNVRCWFAPEDMKIGDEIRARIDESIRLHDKLLLVLSEHSIASAWVQDEVESAYEQENRQRKPVLFPVRLDAAVEETTRAWAAKLRRQRHIGDFTRWKEHDAYQRAFARLLRDLKAETSSPT